VTSDYQLLKDSDSWSRSVSQSVSQSVSELVSQLISTVSLPGAGMPQCYSATGWMIGVPSPGRGWDFSHHRIQTGSEAHRASYPMDIRGSFSGDKAAGT